jgi:integrase
MLGPSYRRRAPHIYSEREVADLLGAASQLGPVDGLRSHTYVTLFGLLASTGLRISEALRLTREDVDFAAALLTISRTKFHKSRLIPLHPTTTATLREYADRRDNYHPLVRLSAFFLTERGTALKDCRVRMTFSTLRRSLGWAGLSGPPRRIHDLRHTFAVRRLLRWYEEGADVDHEIAALSTYMGHVKVTDTYWYLTAVPELLAVAGARYERYAGLRQGGRS